MSKFTNSTESTTDITEPTKSNGYSNTNEAEKVTEEDSGLDDLGYAKTEEKKEIPPPPSFDKKVEEKEVETKSTGYGKEPEASKTEEPVKKEENAESTDEEKLKKEFDEVIKNLPDTLDKEKVAKFAVENKFTKEQLEAYSNLVKEDVKNSELAQKEAVLVQRKDWKNELVSDPEFGGEHFDKNVDRVEKVLEKYMPNMKKVLTERGSMLPPYIMRDFLALSKVLNPVAELVVGDPGQAKEESNFLDDMYK